MTLTIDGDYEVVSDGTVTSVNFQCDKGATIDGPVSLTCQSDGTWTSVQPTCVSCPELEAPSSGNIVLDTDGQTSTVIYACAENYEVVGEATQQCQTDGTWSGSNTTCVCTALEDPANGTVTLENNDLTAKYTCDLYFSLLGDSQRTCMSDGSGWTGSESSCVQCQAMSSPLNGSLTTNTNGTHTISTFTCSLGTSVQGEVTSICKQDATWSSLEPTCVACPGLSDPNSGTVTLSTDGSATTALYACVTGYEVSGEQESTCLQDGSWSNDAPECLCEDPAGIANGSVSSDGREASYRCDVGFSLLGISLLTCDSNGSGWSDQVPRCMECNNLNAPSGGKVELSSSGISTVANFKCDVGSSLDGSTSLTCQVDGSWNGSVPSCVTCEDLSSPVNGEYVVSTDGVTTTAQLQCGSGYEATGTVEVECDTDGQWIYSSESTCEKVEDGSNSLLGALIGVSVTSLVIIVALSVMLAIFVYLYLQKKKGEEKYTDISLIGTSNYPDVNSDDILDLHPVKVAKSLAPVNHQRPVFDVSGPFSTSPAPQGFEDHMSGNGAVPMSPPSVETHRSGNSVISFRRSATTVTNNSLASVSAITIAAAQDRPTDTKVLKKKENGITPAMNGTTPLRVPNLKLGRLSPIPNHERRLGKLKPTSPNPQIERVIKESHLDSGGRQSPSVMNHALNVSNFDSGSIDSVSIVGE